MLRRINRKLPVDAWRLSCMPSGALPQTQAELLSFYLGVLRGNSSRRRAKKYLTVPVQQQLAGSLRLREMATWRSSFSLL